MGARQVPDLKIDLWSLPLRGEFRRMCRHGRRGARNQAGQANAALQGPENRMEVGNRRSTRGNLAADEIARRLVAMVRVGKPGKDPMPQQRR